MQWCTLQYYLSSDTQHTVYEAELVGLILAITLLQDPNYLEDVTIAIDNQAAIKALNSFQSLPGQYLVDQFLWQIHKVAKQHHHAPLEVHWVPGHKGIKGNEIADKLEKQTAEEHSSPALILPQLPNSLLPTSKLALKTPHTKQQKKEATSLFVDSPRYCKLQQINPTVLSSDFCKLVATLPYQQSSILVQLWTSHVQLWRYLYNISSVGTPLCPSCTQKEETLWNFLLTCTAYMEQHQHMINTLRCNALDLAKLLSDPVCTEYMLDYVHATKHFH